MTEPLAKIGTSTKFELLARHLAKDARASHLTTVCALYEQIRGLEQALKSMQRDIKTFCALCIAQQHGVQGEPLGGYGVDISGYVEDCGGCPLVKYKETTKYIGER